MGYVAMTTHLPHSNDGPDCITVDSTVAVDRRRLAISFEQLRPSHGRTLNWKLSESSKSFSNYLRLSTYSNNSFFVAWLSRPALENFAFENASAYARGIHPSGVLTTTYGDAVPVSCCTLTMALIAVTCILRTNAISVQTMQKSSNR